MSRKIHPRPRFRSLPGARGSLRIGDAARLLGLSPSLLRAWEHLGLLRPARTRARYRIYSAADLRLLKRARYLRRVRGLNAPAIVHLLRSRGRVPPRRQPRLASPGPSLRALRLARKLSLADVARAASVSTGFVSALERGHSSASVGTLRRLARFYGVSILSLFRPGEENPHHVRSADRRVLLAGPGVRMELLAWGGVVMEPHLFRIAPGSGSGESYSHEGEEFLHVLRGQLDISLEGGHTHRLRTGDSFYFESSTPHHWRNPGRTEAQILWVNTPPTF